ncbi:esterase, partial [Pyrenophora tritici-repentis]
APTKAEDLRQCTWPKEARRRPGRRQRLERQDQQGARQVARKAAREWREHRHRRWQPSHKTYSEH